MSLLCLMLKFTLLFIFTCAAGFAQTDSLMGKGSGKGKPDKVNPSIKAGAAPFNRHKSYTTEGGIVAPLIMTGKNISGGGSIRTEFVTVMDLAPTFLQMAQVDFANQKDERVKRMLGESMAPYLMNQVNYIHDENYVTALEHEGRMYCRKGSWKIVNLEKPYDEKTFVLYDLKNDPAETTNVAEQYPEKFSEMLAEWKKYCNANGLVVVPPSK